SRRPIRRRRDSESVHPDYSVPAHHHRARRIHRHFKSAARIGSTLREGEMSAETLYERVEHAARTVRARRDEDISVALVLGSGLGAFADDLEDAVAIPYSEIPGFARPTVEGHAGRLVIGRVDGLTVAV